MSEKNEMTEQQIEEAVRTGRKVMFTRPDNSGAYIGTVIRSPGRGLWFGGKKVSGNGARESYVGPVDPTHLAFG
ncbi:MAG: hypothetical protein V1756_00845 [Patescibacteria group bacterium]